MLFVLNKDETDSTRIDLSRKKSFPPHKTPHSHNCNHNHNPQFFSHNLYPQNQTLSKNQRKIDRLFFKPLPGLLHLIDRKHLLQLEVESEKNAGKEKIATRASKLDHPALTSQMLEMSKIKNIRRVPHNPTLLLVKDPTTAEKERNPQKKTAAQIGKITVAAQKESNLRIGTLTQDMTLTAIIATLPATTLPTTTITLPPDKDNTPKSVILITMIEMFLTNDMCDAIPHTTITVKIVHRHPMLTHSREICLMAESTMLFPKKPQKKF
jgi:hypothetical protein